MALLVSHDACQLRRADYGKPGDPDRDQWFWLRGDTFALAVLLAFIMMQAQITTFAEAATLIPTTGSVYDYISCGMGRFSLSPVRFALT
ncbi:hypothetical protein MYA98_19760 [Salmonella sp. WGH-01]|nr:hypothetical protein MYA98_19760 [Salmonella sp. WGH-01]